MSIYPAALRTLCITITLLYLTSFVPQVNGSASCPLPPLPDPFNSSSVPLHLQWARLLLKSIEPGSSNSQYKNNNITVWWGPYSCQDTYLSITDCSGIITALLLQCYNYTLAKRSYAFTYADATQNQTNGFINVPKVSNFAVGDILSIRYFYDPVTMANITGRNTGHMGIINEKPFQLKVGEGASEPFIPGTVQWAIPLLDQTSSPHGPTDSRYTLNAPGIGTGALKVYASTADGTVTGYSWSFGDGTGATVYYNQSYNALFAARIPSLWNITAGASSISPLMNVVVLFAFWWAYWILNH